MTAVTLVSTLSIKSNNLSAIAGSPIGLMSAARIRSAKAFPLEPMMNITTASRVKMEATILSSEVDMESTKAMAAIISRIVQATGMNVIRNRIFNSFIIILSFTVTQVAAAGFGYPSRFDLDAA